VGERKVFGEKVKGIKLSYLERENEHPSTFSNARKRAGSSSVEKRGRGAISCWKDYIFTLE